MKTGRLTTLLAPMHREDARHHRAGPRVDRRHGGGRRRHAPRHGRSGCHAGPRRGRLRRRERPGHLGEAAGRSGPARPRRQAAVGVLRRHVDQGEQEPRGARDEGAARRDRPAPDEDLRQRHPRREDAQGPHQAARRHPRRTHAAGPGEGVQRVRARRQRRGREVLGAVGDGAHAGGQAHRPERHRRPLGLLLEVPGVEGQVHQPRHRSARRGPHREAPVLRSQGRGEAGGAGRPEGAGAVARPDPVLAEDRHPDPGRAGVRPGGQGARDGHPDALQGGFCAPRRTPR